MREKVCTSVAVVSLCASARLFLCVCEPSDPLSTWWMVHSFLSFSPQTLVRVPSRIHITYNVNWRTEFETHICTFYSSDLVRGKVIHFNVPVKGKSSVWIVRSVLQGDNFVLTFNTFVFKPFQDEAQTDLFKDPVRTVLWILSIPLIKTNQFML